VETRTQETGCIFVEHGITCRKMTERGTQMCPHHNLLIEHREQEKAKKAAEAQAAARAAAKAMRHGKRD